MKMDLQIGLIVSFSLYRYPLTGIQGINDGLLDLLVQLVIQSVDLHDLAENLLIIAANLRYRVRDNGKASLVASDVAVGDLPRFI